MAVYRFSVNVIRWIAVSKSSRVRSNSSSPEVRQTEQGGEMLQHARDIGRRVRRGPCCPTDCHGLPVQRQSLGVVPLETVGDGQILEAFSQTIVVIAEDLRFLDGNFGKTAEPRGTVRSEGHEARLPVLPSSSSLPR